MKVANEAATGPKVNGTASIFMASWRKILAVLSDSTTAMCT